MSEPTAEARGSWTQTFTGRQFFPLNPRPEDIDPVDIAHALSNLCRYNGHVRRFYSVAEHCVLMSRTVPAEDALWALLHDATEAYVGDMVRPLKKHMPDYCAAEERVALAISERFGIPEQMPESVRDADNRIILDERAALLGDPPADWGIPGEPLGVDIQEWRPERAEREYLARLTSLLAQNHRAA